MVKVRNRYLDYLCNIVGKANKYGCLLEQLHEIEFYSLVPNDDNREADGTHLRNMFIEEEGQHASSFMPRGGCTVLEMLIGLAFRLEFELLGGQYEQPPSYWFWVLIGNLGLSRCTDDRFRREDVRNIVQILLDRQYSTNGRGGLFPLKVSQRDQRRVEIWYQMSAWVIENYPI